MLTKKFEGKKSQKSKAEDLEEKKLYKYSRKGQWKRVIERCSSHPEEADFVCMQKKDNFTLRSTALHEACKDFHPPPPLDVIIALCRISSFAATVQDKNGCTPLHLACAHQRLSVLMISSLVSSFTGAIYYKDNKKRTPLHILCESLRRESCVDATKTLLSFISVSEKNDNKKSKTNPIFSKDDKGRTPLHIVCRQLNHHKAVEIAKTMMEMYPDVAGEQDKYGKTPLHIVCDMLIEDASIEMSKTIIHVSPESVLKQDKKGRTPLHILCNHASSDLLEIMMKILVNFSSLQAFSVQDSNGRSPLHCLLRKKNTSDFVDEINIKSILMIIIQGYAFTCYKNNQTKSHIIDHVDIADAVGLVEMVAESPLAFPTIRDKQQRTLLHHACSTLYVHKSIEMIQLLINCCPGSVSLQDSFGMTALHIICDNPVHTSYPTALIFLNKIVESNDLLTKDLHGDNPLHVVCGRLHHDLSIGIIEELLKKCPRAIFEKNVTGETPLHIVCKQQNDNIIKAIQLLIPVCPFISSLEDINGRTPLHVVNQYNYDPPYQILRILAKSYPEAITKHDNDDQSPLSLFIEHHVEKMEDLPNYLCHFEEEEVPSSRTECETTTIMRQFHDKLLFLIRTAYFSHLNYSLDDSAFQHVLHATVLVITSYYSKLRRPSSKLENMTLKDYVEPIISGIIQLNGTKIVKKEGIAIQQSNSL